jgi:hypothetical protein
MCRWSEGAEPEIRHFGHNGLGVCRAFSALHDQYLAAQVSHELTQAPVIVVKEVIPVKGKSGTVYEPHFQIAKWVQRSESFNDFLPVPVTERGDAYEDAPQGSNGGGNEDLPF